MHFAECGFKVFKGFCTKMIIWRHPDDAFREVERTRMHQNRFHAISNVPACILTTNAEKYQKKSIALRGREISIGLLRRMTCTFGFSSVFVRVRRQRSSRKWKKNINLILAPLKQGALKILIEIYFFRRLISFQTINLLVQCPMVDYITIVPSIVSTLKDHIVLKYLSNNQMLITFFLINSTKVVLEDL